MCKKLVEMKWFDNAVLMFIALNCITLAMERPNIPPESTERVFLATANYVFTFVFAIEMFVKVCVINHIGKDVWLCCRGKIKHSHCHILSSVNINSYE